MRASLSQGKLSHLIAGPVVKDVIVSTIQFLANLYSLSILQLLTEIYIFFQSGFLPLLESGGGGAVLSLAEHMVT